MHKSATRREETFLRAATGLVQMALTCKRVFSIFKYMSGGGADNSLIGTNGSCNAASTITILHELGAEDRIVFDFGAGDAKFLICAAVSGAKRAIGVEFPENVGHQLLFDAVVQRISQLYGILLPVTWIGMDIDEVVLFFPSLPSTIWGCRRSDFFYPQMDEIPGNPDCIYSFWVGIPPQTQIKILSLCAKCASVKRLAVYHEATKWNIPEDGTCARAAQHDTHTVKENVIFAVRSYRRFGVVLQ